VLNVLALDHIVVGWLPLKDVNMFRCFSVADRQYRDFDVVGGSQFVDLARRMNMISFKYLQKSQVHVIENDVLVIVSENDGESLSRFAVKIATAVDESFLRHLIKDLLEAVFYVSDTFGIDFKFTSEDVIVNSGKGMGGKPSFRLRNTFIQKARINLLRANTIKNHLIHNTSECRKPNSECSKTPVLAIRSLGSLVTGIAKNRYGFSDCQLDFSCSWASESLREVITSMAHYTSLSFIDPRSFLSKFMTGMEMKFERMKNAKLSRSGGQPRRRSLESLRNSNPF